MGEKGHQYVHIWVKHPVISQPCQVFLRVQCSGLNLLISDNITDLN